MPTRSLDARFVSTATSDGKAREFYWDSSLPGFGLMVTANGARSFVVQYRNADGISRRMTINGGRTLAAARREAKRKFGEVAGGRDPLADKQKQRDAREDTLRRIVENEYYTDDDVKKLRSLYEKKGTFERYIFPTLGTRPVTEIKRSEIVRMLRHVKQKHGPGAADMAFKVLSRFFTWFIPFADDDFVSPIVRGTWSQTQGDGARTLTDDEIRILWNVASEGRKAYDHFIRFTLLTATRLSEAAQMTRGELSLDGTEWTIPAHRYKGQDGKSAHAHLIPLSPLARDVLAKTPVHLISGKPSQWVFTNWGTKPIAGFTSNKTLFDRRLHAALEKEGHAVRDRIIADLNDRYPGKGYQPFDGNWRTHSLRKTARTLLSRVKIDERTAERCLGHVTGGIIGKYDHHEHKAEKRAAFEALAREIERIVEGKSANVVPLSSARA
jgi:Phage integrase family/Arm DNA-binding domain/Phage integrase central domain